MERFKDFKQIRIYVEEYMYGMHHDYADKFVMVYNGENDIYDLDDWYESVTTEPYYDDDSPLIKEIPDWDIMSGLFKRIAIEHGSQSDIIAEHYTLVGAVAVTKLHSVCFTEEVAKDIVSKLRNSIKYFNPYYEITYQNNEDIEILRQHFTGNK